MLPSYQHPLQSSQADHGLAIKAGKEPIGFPTVRKLKAENRGTWWQASSGMPDRSGAHLAHFKHRSALIESSEPESRKTEVGCVEPAHILDRIRLAAAPPVWSRTPRVVEPEERVVELLGESGRTLLVASSGGHLKELYALRPRLSLGNAVEWATFDTPQSRSVLEGEVVHFVRFIAPRDLKSVALALPSAWRILRKGRYSRVVSTGSAIALAFLPVARGLGAECHYIESAARRLQPSLTGRLVARVPEIRLYHQSLQWADATWSYGGSVFDEFEPISGQETRIGRVVVTVGTQDFSFRRLVERLVQILPPGVEVLWQTGRTDTSGLPITTRPELPAGELVEAIRGADVVVSHAGVGSALSILESGHCPVLIPRRHERGEHIDDHQRLIAAELVARGLSVSCEADEVVLDDLRRAAAVRIRSRAVQSLFELRR